MQLGRILLWLLVIGLGVEIGAGLFEARVLVPLWSASPPTSLINYNLQAMQPHPGPSFWMISTPLVGLLGVANLVAAWRNRDPMRRWWLTGAVLTVAVVVATFVYFVPVLLGFEHLREGGSADTASRVHQWVTLNWIRAVIYVAAWLCLLRAFSGGTRVTAIERPMASAD